MTFKQGKKEHTVFGEACAVVLLSAGRGQQAKVLFKLNAFCTVAANELDA